MLSKSDKKSIDMFVMENGLYDPMESYGRCTSLSKQIMATIPGSRLITGLGFCGVMAKDAHPSYTRYPKWISHTVVIVGDDIVDVTSYQFGSKYLGVHSDISEFSEMWKVIVEDCLPSNFLDKATAERRYGLLPYFDIERF